MSSIDPSLNNLNFEAEMSGESLMELTNAPADSLLESVGAAQRVTGAGGDVVKSINSAKSTRDGSGEMASGNKSNSSIAGKATNKPLNVNFTSGRPLSFACSTGFTGNGMNSAFGGKTKPGFNGPILRFNGRIPRVYGPIPVFDGTTPGIIGPKALFGGPNRGFGGLNAGFWNMNAGFSGQNAGFGGINAGFGGPIAGFGGQNASLGGMNASLDGS